jgi:hypothetical protein
LAENKIKSEYLLIFVLNKKKYFFGTGEVPVSDEPVLPEARQAVRGQQDVCLAG